ncbi:aminoglycoside phosphotransferase family protein [Nocardiopsis sp. NPDC058631]|uniref:aminoglycoside phosphotransferase family protein n=1 Tax=Nocardiopsis sp. NPDC058631 TaxID=3346566 RepID=UPI0036486FB6
MHEPTSPPPPITVPRALAPLLDHNFGPEWTCALPALTGLHLRRWNLTPTGAPMHGMVALVVPVRRADGSPAVLKMQPVDDETEGEPVALRVWAGDGAVRLLEHDPATGALLLEALDPARTLEHEPLDRALTVIGELLARLNAHPGPDGVRGLATVTRSLVRRTQPFLADERIDGRARRSLARWTAVAREMASEPGDRLLHWDLHYANVLAPLPGTRPDPWVAIDPKPLVGDPGYELMPALRNRFAEEAAPGRAPASVRRRFDLLTEAAGIDRDRARAWTLVRALEDCLWQMEDGRHARFGATRAVADALAG